MSHRALHLITGLLILLLILLWWGSSHLFTVSESVVIEAPVEDVWEYVSDSENAREWSVYFHHIAPMEGVEDGKPGAIRRCYRSLDKEEDVYWDEITLETIPHEYRRILAYNKQGFPEDHQHLEEGEHYVYQYYEEMGPEQTKLTFSTTILRPEGLFDRLKFWKFGQLAEETFDKNLENIKLAVEAEVKDEPYDRKHPYIEPGGFEID